LFAALLLAPCLYSQAALPFGDSAFRGLFRVPDFETPRLTNLANLTDLTDLADLTDTSGSFSTAAENPEKAVSLTPLWLKDLRRAEIVAFGSFPLSIFWTSFFMDLYRTSSHDWDNRYAPWPFKGAGAVGMTDQEIKTMFTIAISSSLVIAVVDHFIMRYRRSKAGDANSGPVKLDKMSVPGD
jgi:hypothetical protein